MIIAKIKTWAIAALSGLAALLAAFTLGRREGRARAKEAETARRLKSKKEMEEVKNEIETQDDAHLVDVLDDFVHPKRR